MTIGKANTIQVEVKVQLPNGVHHCVDRVVAKGSTLRTANLDIIKQLHELADKYDAWSKICEREAFRLERGD